MRPDVVTVNPTNNPSSTTISTTANTMPVSVTVSRILSCRRLRLASGGIPLPSLFQKPAKQHVRHGLCALLERFPLHPLVGRLRDLQRDHSVYPGPQRLRDQLRVAVFVTEHSRINRLLHQIAQH